MRYRELIQFDPIETVVQLRGAEDVDAAARLVSTYVISRPMADRLSNLVIPQLQFRRPADQKGLLVVGNYGTGKSHLLATLSAIAERADLAGHLRDGDVQAKAQEIAGQFRVIRMEIGATEMRLRDIVVGWIEDALGEWGIDYRFPSMTAASNSKDPLNAMMERFQERFPEQGLLLVVDELLDYLRSRDEQALILDLNFLREIGEVCRDTRLRFIGGVQESLFDSPSFQFVASALNRVKDRFEQVPIAREDVTFVVAERLLRKSPEQRARIRAYLEPFAPLYPEMAERLDTYINLFPVHPAYIETFEAIRVVEKREILKTLSRAMTERLDDQVPADHPGLIAYDSYWAVLRANPGFRSIPDVRDVLDKSKVLEEKVESAYTRPAYKPVALRIIHALSVHRLTTGDLKAPIGVTPAELRDTLCLYLPLPEPDAEFLVSTIESAIKEISRTVNGQFLSFNADNGQWYLDLAKDIDYDALIEQRAATLSPGQLDRYFYDALARVMERADVTVHVPGFRIWEHEADWPEKKVTRPGYLFFGAPNQRSTAQPPREFYLYFLQPYDPPEYTDEKRPDEVFFRLKTDAEFDRNLRLYGGAMALADAASTATKGTYREKASSTSFQRPGYLQRLIGWLTQTGPSALEVTYQGAARPAVELMKGQVISFRDLVNGAASSCLAPVFRERLPEYPTFPIQITAENRTRNAAEAIRWIVGPLRTQQGAAILGALELLDGDRLAIDRSRYARHVREALAARGEGQVLNRADLITSEYSGTVEYDRRFHLEPEWLAVVLAALVYAGEITIARPGLKLDAGALDQLAKLPIADLTNFTYIERPRDLPLVALTALFELLDLSAGLVKDPNQHQAAVQELQKAVTADLERTLTLRKRVADGISCWNANVIEGTERDGILARFDAYKGFLDGLTSLNTPGKLKNFRPSADDVRAQATARETLRRLDRLLALVGELQPLTAYLLQAHAVLPADDPLAVRIVEAQGKQLAALRDPAARSAPGVRESLLSEGQALKADYIQEYARRHARTRLNLDQDRHKAALLQGPTMKRLRALRAVTILPGGTLAEVEASLVRLGTCVGFSPGDLATTPVCPHCGFRPVEERGDEAATARLGALEDRLEALARDWTTSLLQNLDDPTVADTLSLLGPTERAPLDQFVSSRQLPETVDGPFLKALRDAFTDLERLAIGKDALLSAITNGGAPTTADELKARFAAFVDARMRGKDFAKVRIVVE